MYQTKIGLIWRQDTRKLAPFFMWLNMYNDFRSTSIKKKYRILKAIQNIRLTWYTFYFILLSVNIDLYFTDKTIGNFICIR